MGHTTPIATSVRKTRQISMLCAKLWVTLSDITTQENTATQRVHSKNKFGFYLHLLSSSKVSAPVMSVIGPHYTGGLETVFPREMARWAHWCQQNAEKQHVYFQMAKPSSGERKEQRWRSCGIVIEPQSPHMEVVGVDGWVNKTPSYRLSTLASLKHDNNRLQTLTKWLLL